MTRFAAVLAVVCLALFAVSATAATWTHLGTSGFTKLTPSQLQDHKRVIMNSMVKDDAGNLWMTASYDDTNTSGDGLYAFGSGITIFKAGFGSKVDFDLKAAGYDGCVTKLVLNKAATGGDGCVYALQNYLNIEWSYMVVTNRVLRLKLNPNDTVTVTEVYTPGAVVPWNLATKKLGGLAAGDDGCVYWTHNGNDSSYGRYNFFHRCRYDNVQQSYYIEQAPNRPVGGTGECESETHRMLDLEYLGGGQFAIVGAYYNWEWQCSPISWTVPHVGVDELPINKSNPTWGRKWNVVNAYDPLRKKMWSGGRGESPYVEYTKAGAGATIVDLGGGNKALQMVAAGATNEYYTDKPGVPAASSTCAARFKVDAYSGDKTILWLYPNSGKSVAKLGLHADLKIIGGRWKLFDGQASPAIEIADMGPVALGAWNEIYLYCDAETGRVRCNWNGTEVFNNIITVGTNKTWIGWFEFGDISGSAANSTTVWDWVALGPGFIAPGEMTSKYFFYNDGSALPNTQYVASNIMSRWDGELANATIFNAEKKVKSSAVWHANSYDEVNSALPGKRLSSNYLGTNYWVSAMAVNPVTGEAWTAFGANPNYTYTPADHVLTMPVKISNTRPGYGDEGAPESGAQVMNLMYDGGKMYALTCNLTTGAYKVYAADVPPAAPQTIGAIKNAKIGSQVQTVGTAVVTYPSNAAAAGYFYIEDPDRTSGIKVIPANLADMKVVGKTVQVTGLLDVQNGEAVIDYATVVETGVGSVEALAMPVRSLGGVATGVQPATVPGYGLTNVGLFVRVAGKATYDSVSGFYFLDDGSGQTLKVDYDFPGDGDVIVAGILAVDPAVSGGRILLVRDEDDVTLIP